MTTRELSPEEQWARRQAILEVCSALACVKATALAEPAAYTILDKAYDALLALAPYPDGEPCGYAGHSIACRCSPPDPDRCGTEEFARVNALNRTHQERLRLEARLARNHGADQTRHLDKARALADELESGAYRGDMHEVGETIRGLCEALAKQ